MNSSLLFVSILFFSCSKNFLIWLKTSDDIWSRKNMKRYWQLASKYLLHIAKISQCFRVRSFGLIRIQISDPRSLGSWCIKQGVASVADETKLRYSLSANQWPNACSAPAMLPGFSIIGSNWLLHVAVISCTVIGRVDLVEPWLRSRLILDTQHNWTRLPAATTELAFEAVKRNSNYLTIFPNNGNLWKSFWDNDVFVNLPAGFGKSLIFRCLPIVADIVLSKPKHACMTSA